VSTGNAADFAMTIQGRSMASSGATTGYLDMSLDSPFGPPMIEINERIPGHEIGELETGR